MNVIDGHGARSYERRDTHCEWVCARYEGGIWRTACGKTYPLVNDNPDRSAGDLLSCQGCGKTLSLVWHGAETPLFVPHSQCTEASGDCISEGRCLSRCRYYDRKALIAAVKDLERRVVGLEVINAALRSP